MGSGPGHLLCVVCKAIPAQEGERLGSGPPLPPMGKVRDMADSGNKARRE